jgi:hypothetical protein
MDISDNTLIPAPFVALVVLLSLGACADPGPGFDLQNGEAILQGAACGSGPSTCPGAEMPDFQLEDFQPASEAFETTYGLEVFKGKPTVVALLAAW